MFVVGCEIYVYIEIHTNAWSDTMLSLCFSQTNEGKCGSGLVAGGVVNEMFQCATATMVFLSAA